MSLSTLIEKPSDRLLGFLLIVTFALLYLAFLGVRPLYIPDEVRYGEIAREMLATGDWVVPRLNGLLYFEKPPLGHWLNAISLYLFGENPFAVRLASVFATGVSALTVLFLGRMLFDDRRIAFFAVFIFLTTFEVQGVGTFSVLDATFAGALNLGIAFFVAASFRTGSKRTVLLCLSGVCLGMAFLAKGFLAFALPVLVIVPWLLLQKQYRLLFVEAWLVVLTAALVIAPWAFAIHSKEPDFWRYFFWVEHIQRFVADNAQHKEPFYYFLIYLPAVAFPWIFLAPTAIRSLFSGVSKSARASQSTVLAIWALMPLLFFSIASGKLITYILPCFVPFSLLLAAGLSQTLSRTRVAPFGLRAAALIPAIACVAVLYVTFVADDLPRFGPDETGKLVLLLFSLVLTAGVLVYASVDTHRTWLRALWPGVSMICLLTCLPWLMPEVSLERKAPVAFIQEIGANLPSSTVIVTDGSLVRAVSWSLKRADVFVVDGGGETTYGLNAPDAAGRFLDGDAFSKLLDESSSVLLVCKGSCSADTRSRLPSNIMAITYGNFSAFRIPDAKLPR